MRRTTPLGRVPIAIVAKLVVGMPASGRRPRSRMARCYSPQQYAFATTRRSSLLNGRAVVSLDLMDPQSPLAPRPRSAARIGFFDGVTALFGGLGFIVTTPRMWGWALIPTVVASGLFVGLGGLGVWGGASLAERVVGESVTAWASAGLWTLRVVFGLVGLIVAFLLSISFAQPLSGFALDAIARRQEMSLSGRQWPDQPVFASTVRALSVTLTALAISLPLLVILATITFFFPPASVITIPLKFLVTGLAVAYDFLDYPLGLRGVGVRVRLRFIADHFGAVLGFGASAALLLLIPGLGLILLPFGVAGATRLVVSSDQACQA